MEREALGRFRGGLSTNGVTAPAVRRRRGSCSTSRPRGDQRQREHVPTVANVTAVPVGPVQSQVSSVDHGVPPEASR